MSVVPTFAPSMMASAGARSTAPPVTKEAVIRPVAVLLCRRAVTTMPARKAKKRLRSAVPSRLRRSDPGPYTSTVDHMQAPQQQCDTAHKVQKDNAAQLFLLSFGRL